LTTTPFPEPAAEGARLVALAAQAGQHADPIVISNVLDVEHLSDSVLDRYGESALA
jgi:hypothetical protein